MYSLVNSLSNARTCRRRGEPRDAVGYALVDELDNAYSVRARHDPLWPRGPARCRVPFRGLAQITVGAVSGVIRDDQKLPLPGATVELLNEQTGDIRQTVSNESGVFVISAVPQGRHTLKVALSGFKTVEQRGSKALLDEIPSAYKDIDEVMEQARCLVDVRHVLRQFLNVKGD